MLCKAFFFLRCLAKTNACAERETLIYISMALERWDRTYRWSGYDHDYIMCVLNGVPHDQPGQYTDNAAKARV